MMYAAHNDLMGAGIVSLPVKPDKTPACPSWKGGWNSEKEYQGAYGIAIVCGAASGNLEVIDFDNSFGDIQEVFASWGEFEEVKEILEKYKFPIQATPRKGFHILYRCDTIAGNEKLAERLKNGKRATLIETRSEAGYACSIPTPGYKLLYGDILNPPTIAPEEREILLSACRSFNEVLTERIKTKKGEEEQTDRPGDIYNRSREALEEMRRTLLDHGWNEVRECYWRRPGKDSGSSSATLGKVAPGVFYVFSSNADPFESNHGYSAFQVVGLLKYNGDFGRFAKELYQTQNPDKKERIEPTPTQPPQEQTDLMEQCRINPLSDLIEPPVYCSIGDTPTMTAGNFSMINGKKKAGKTWLLIPITGSVINNSNQLGVIQGCLPSGKKTILYFDTEQSKFHATRTIKRICGLIKEPNPGNLIAYGLRPYTPKERLQFIEEKIKQYQEKLAMVVIDGIRDLLTIGINDEAEATALTSKFLKWTETYFIHMILLLHQNKTDLNARGHIGTEMLNKAETIISVTKDESEIFIVSCEDSRDVPFKDFAFIIQDGQVVSAGMPNDKKSKSKNPKYIDDEKHWQVLDEIFREKNEYHRRDFEDAIVYGFDNAFGQNACRGFIKHYITKDWINYERKGQGSIYTYNRARF